MSRNDQITYALETAPVPPSWEARDALIAKLEGGPGRWKRRGMIAAATLLVGGGLALSPVGQAASDALFGDPGYVDEGSDEVERDYLRDLVRERQFGQCAEAVEGGSEDPGCARVLEDVRRMEEAERSGTLHELAGPMLRGGSNPQPSERSRGPDAR